MSIIYILIPIAVLLTAIGIYIFFWAVKAEQFNDLEKQGMSILFDDDAPANNTNNTNNTKNANNSDKNETTKTSPNPTKNQE